MRPDQELVQEAKNGNRTAFSELVVRHQKQMMRVALRMSRDWDQAEDIVQESFIKAYQNLTGFEGRASFRSWLYQITLNTAKNRLRSVSRESVNIDHVTLGIDDRVENKMIEVHVKNLIRDEIARLPDRQQTALTLRIYEDLSFKEIAEIMQCPYDTAKANYRHALLKLRERIEAGTGLEHFKAAESGFWVEFSASSLEVES